MSSLDPDFCVIGMLIDKSSSMSDMGVDKITEGCNDFIRSQRESDESNGTKTNLFFGTFSSTYNLVYKNINLEQFGEITKGDVQPNGLTALLDSLDTFIDDIGNSLNEMSVRPGKVIIFILTDGYENSSCRLRGYEGRDKLTKKIKHQEEKYSWTFYYAGANQDSIKVGASLGINMETCVDYGFTGDALGSAMITASSAILRERGGGSSGFTNEERETLSATLG